MPINSLVLSEKNIDEKLDQAMREVLAESYNTDFLDKGRIFNGNIPIYTVILLDNDIICAHAAVIDARIVIEGNDFRVAGLGYLCVTKQYRGQNLGRQIADICMQEADKDKFDFGLLFTTGTLPKIYSPLGWKSLAADFFYLEDESAKQLPIEILRMYYPLTKKDFPTGDVYLQQNYW